MSLESQLQSWLAQQIHLGGPAPQTRAILEYCCPGSPCLPWEGSQNNPLTRDLACRLTHDPIHSFIPSTAIELPPYSVPGSLHPIFGLKNTITVVPVEGGEALQRKLQVLILMPPLVNCVALGKSLSISKSAVVWRGQREMARQPCVQSAATAGAQQVTAGSQLVRVFPSCFGLQGQS